jgi:hypothetical protein
VIEWFGNTLSTRPDDKQVARLVVMQRIHVDDLVGHLLETEAAAAAAVVAKNVRLFIFKRLAAAAFASGQRSRFPKAAILARSPGI